MKIYNNGYIILRRVENLPDKVPTPMTRVSTKVSSVIDGPRTAMPCEMHDATSDAFRTEQLSDQ